MNTKGATISEHVLYCIDSPLVTEDVKRATRITGWLLYTSYIKSVWMDIPQLGSKKIPYGLSRPDVTGSTFEEYPNAGYCGFTMDVPEGAVEPQMNLKLTLTVKGRFGISEHHIVNIGISSNSIQRVTLCQERRFKRISPLTLEQNLKDSLEAKPGIALRLDIINKCNLKCIMCHYADDNIFKRPVRKLTVDKFEQFFKDIAPYVRSIILSCWDEPLMSNYFPDLLSHISERYPHIEIEFCTNGMLMNADIRRLIIEKGITYLMFSMDGVYKKTLESIRIGANYEKIVGNILALKDLKKVSSSKFPVFIMDFVMMASNIHEAPSFVELSSRLGAKMIDFRHAIPSPVFNDPMHFLCNHREKYNYFRKQIIKEGRRLKIDIVIPPAYQASEDFSPTKELYADLSDFEKVSPDDMAGDVPVPRKFPWWFKPRNTRGTSARLFKTTYCERPFSEITILDQEWIKPCPWHKTHLGRLSEGRTLQQVFFGNEFTQLRKNMLKLEGDPNCGGCPWKGDLLIGKITQYGSAYQKYLRKLYALKTKAR